jgi:hypothetical protein
MKAGGGADRPLGDDRLPRLGQLLEPGRHIHGQARDERLTRSRMRRRDRLTRIDSGADLELEAQSLVHLGQTRADPECSAQRAHRIVLVRRRDAKDGHDRITDVLLDRPALRLDLAAHSREPLVHHLAQLLDVQPVGKRGRPGHVGKQNGHDLALGSHVLIVKRLRVR